MSKQNQGSITRALAEFPFLSKILMRPLEPLYGPDKSGEEKLTIKVSRADSNLMFRQGAFEGFNIGEIYSSRDEEPRDDYYWQQGEYCYAVDSIGNICNEIAWPRNYDERKALGKEVYVRDILLRKGFNLFETVVFIVFVTVRMKYKPSGNDDNGASVHYDAPLERTVDVTVFKKPEIGFQKLYRHSTLEENVIISQDLLVRNHSDAKYCILRGRLDELCRWFQDEVFEEIHQAILVSPEPIIRMRGHIDQKVLLEAGNAIFDYIIVMLHGPESRLTLQLRPGASNNLICTHVFGTLPAIRNLIRQIIITWKAKQKK